MNLTELPDTALDIVIASLGKYSKGALSATCKDIRSACKDRIKRITINPDTASKHFQHLPQLKEIHIHCPPHWNTSSITDWLYNTDISHRLNKLAITAGNMSLTPELFVALGTLSGLRELIIHPSMGSASLEGIETLSALTRLELVKIRGPCIKDLQPLQALTALRDLFIEGILGYDTRALTAVAALTTLTTLTSLKLSIYNPDGQYANMKMPKMPSGLQKLNVTLVFLDSTFLNELLSAVPDACDVGVRLIDTKATPLMTIPGRIQSLELTRWNPIDLRTLTGLRRLVLNHEADLSDLCVMLAQTPGCTVELRGGVGNGVTFQKNRAADLQVLARSRVFTRTSNATLHPGIAIYMTRAAARIAELLIRAGVDVGMVARNVLELERNSKHHTKWMKHAKWLDMLEVMNDTTLNIWPLPPTLTRITHVYVEVESENALRKCLCGAVKRGVELRVDIPTYMDMNPFACVVHEYGCDPDDVLCKATSL